jgi:hypothetical protein
MYVAGTTLSPKAQRIVDEKKKFEPVIVTFVPPVEGPWSGAMKAVLTSAKYE